MDFDYTDEQKRYRAEIVSILDEIVRQLDADESSPERAATPRVVRSTRQLGANHLLGLSWPKEFGGQARSLWDERILSEEMVNRGLQVAGLGVSVVGPTIMAFGTEAQRNHYLPGILNGDLMFSISYTEPNAGTDLAAMQTRAVRDGDDYVINGHKIYTSTAHYTNHMLVACRTSTELPKHRGISMIIVPNDAPGVTIRPQYTQSNIQTNEVYFDDVRVPVGNRIGEENNGWQVMMVSLNFERFLVMATPKRQLERLVKYANETIVDGKPLIQDPHVKRTLARLTVDLEVGSLLSVQGIWTVEQGEQPTAEASMIKVWGSEYGERIANAAIDIMGPQAILHVDDPGAVIEGIFEAAYRHFPMHKFGGGTNEVQRNIIAQRRLGLPRG